MSAEGAVVVAVDQGSGGTKALALTLDGDIVGSGTVALAEQRPRPGWVEQNPLEIKQSVRTAVAQCLTGIEPSRVATVGLSNQRESLVLWERATGRPVAPLVSWQDGRTRELCERLRHDGVADLVERVSGLPLDPMFSALKARWLLDTHDPDRSRSRRGELCLGTVDSWLLSTPGRHVVEIGNASRTQLLDLSTGTWSAELLEIFAVPASVLPNVLASDGDDAAASALADLPNGVPVGAVLGDSHAALFGAGVRGPGPMKATYGTGSSVMTLSGRAEQPEQPAASGLCRTIAWQCHRPDGSLPAPSPALEGNIRATGATLVWLARLLSTTPAGIAALAEGTDSGGLDLVPAFGGLGAPWWDSAATGLLSGLSLSTGPQHLARAALESIALQVTDVVAAVRDAGADVTELLTDGGASSNDTLMQLQADLAATVVRRSTVANLSALGAAHLAGLSVGVWDEAALTAQARPRDRFEPRLAAAERGDRLARWRAAVDRSRLAPSHTHSTAARSEETS
jgi:glycerol kinase